MRALDWPLRRDEVQNFFSPAGIVSGPLTEDQRRVLAAVDEAPCTEVSGGA